MKWSKFIFKTENEKEVILYNTLNGAVIKLDKDLYSKMLNNDKENHYIKKLIENEMLIDINFDENEAFISSFFQEWNNCGFLDLHIVLTTGCNFRCPYCYQEGIRPEIMSKEKADEILKFLRQYIKINNIKECAFEITGGEPTTNWSLAEYLTTKLANIFKENSVMYKLHIVTNGYNLTSEKVDFLVEYNWERVQITLDGLPEVSNKRRVLINRKPSFDRIINNMDYIINNNKISKVNLRINYDKSNIQDIPEFLLYIKKRYDISKIKISLGLITKTVKTSNANKFIELYGITDEDFVESYLFLYKYAYNLGFEMTDIFSFSGMCTAKLKHGFLIEPNGSIVKCVSGVGRNEFKIGDIKERKEDVKDFTIDYYSECLQKECPYVSICHAGCEFDSFITYGNKKKVVCKKSLMDKINSEIIKINYMED